MSNYKIGLIIGSLRKDSWSRKIAQVLISMAPKSLTLEIIEIGKLPLYNQDDDNQLPEASLIFKEQVKKMDGIMFITPEYNRSIPGVLKNALDIASRPYGQSAWDGKPTAIISLSIGALAGFGANHHLRQCLTFLNMPSLQQPEMYLSYIASLFDESGSLNNKDTEDFLRKYLTIYADWVHTLAKK